MEFVLICIVLFLGKSSQQLNSEELDDILDKLMNQIKNNNTFEVTNASEDNTSHGELIGKSSDESKIIYVRTYNKPVIEFILDNNSDISQQYPKISNNFSALDDSQNISEINEPEYILEEIESLSDNIPTDKDHNVKQSSKQANKPTVIRIKGYNKPIFRDVQNKSSNLTPLEQNDTTRGFDNLSLPDEILSLIKENKDKGIILKEIVVEIEHNVENITDTGVFDHSKSSKSELTETSKDVITITTDPALPDIITESYKNIISKISGKKRNQKKTSRVTNTNNTKDSKKLNQMDSNYLADRTVPLEEQEQYKALNLNVPQVSDVNVYPTPNRFENLESRPFLWRSTVPQAIRCNENCVLRKLFPTNNLYPILMSRSPYIPNTLSQPLKPIIVTPRSAKLQMNRALQNMYSMSTTQNGPTYYITDIMDRIWSRKIYQPSYSKFVYL